MPYPRLPDEPSARGAINFEDLKSLIFTGLLFGAAACITFLVEHLASLKLDDYWPGLEAFVIMILGMLGKVIQKVLNGPVVVALLVGLCLLAAPAESFAEELVIDAGNKPGIYYLKIIVGLDGAAHAYPVQKVITLTEPTPQPNPTPVPVPPGPVILSERAKAVKAAAEKVAGDPDRDGTAKGMAVLYREVAKAARLGKVPDGAALSNMLRMGTDMLLTARGDRAPAAWQPVRDLVSTQWTNAAAKGASVADLVVLLEDAANGFDASAPKKEISPAMLALIMQIIKIVLELLAK